MYNIIPLILILISLSVIIIILARKFSALANLDVDNIPAEKEAKFKEQIIGKRLKRNIVKYSAKFNNLIKPAGIAVSRFFKSSYKKLHELKDNYKNREVLTDDDAANKVDELFKEAGEPEKQADLSVLEKIYIDIIGLDSQNIKAFRELAQIYFKRKEYEEAKQTLEHILRLGENEEIYERSQIYFDLALILRGMENLGKAIENMKHALRIEPNNPRYLDFMIEISIINKDKISAFDAHKKLKEVNPDNQKLDEFKKEIDEL